MWISQAWAQAAGDAAGSGIMGTFMGLAPLLLIFVVFWFFLIRPQQKKMKEHRAMVAALKKGDRVLTNGGLLGVVTRVVDDAEAEIEIAQGVRVRVLRQAVSEILNRSAAAAPAATGKSEGANEG